jgi:HK97 family phage major capsid protein
LPTAACSRSASSSIPTRGNALPIPTDNDTSNSGAILTENTQTGAQDVTFGAVTLNAYTYTSKLVLVSNQLLQDSAFNLDAFLSGKLGTRIARAINTHFTTGDGASKPNGVVTAATLGKAGATGQTASIIWDDIIDLHHSVDPSYRRNGRFMMADSSLKIIKKLKDGDGRYLWQSGVALKEPDTIDGKPYTVNQDMAAMATSAKPLLFGDFSKYFIRKVTGVQVLRLVERYADYNQTGFLAFERWDGNLVDAGTHPVKYYANAAS